MTQNEKDPKIVNRESWLKIFLIALVAVFVVYKLAVTPMAFDFTKLDSADFLNLILAMFAIGMSAAFYFKATDTSNRFYDNSYKFTKDMSEILGRKEAGFGERLRRIDEHIGRLVQGEIQPSQMIA